MSSLIPATTPFSTAGPLLYFVIAYVSYSILCPNLLTTLSFPPPPFSFSGPMAWRPCL